MEDFCGAIILFLYEECLSLKGVKWSVFVLFLMIRKCREWLLYITIMT